MVPLLVSCSLNKLLVCFWFIINIFGLVHSRVPHGACTPVVSFASILTVDLDIDIVLRGDAVRVPGTAHVPSLVHAADLAQHQPGSIVVRVGRDRAVRALPLDLVRRRQDSHHLVIHSNVESSTYSNAIRHTVGVGQAVQ